jgi:hypothetical protein
VRAAPGSGPLGRPAPLREKWLGIAEREGRHGPEGTVPSRFEKGAGSWGDEVI